MTLQTVEDGSNVIRVAPVLAPRAAPGDGIRALRRIPTPCDFLIQHGGAVHRLRRFDDPPHQIPRQVLRVRGRAPPVEPPIRILSVIEGRRGEVEVGFDEIPVSLVFESERGRGVVEFRQQNAPPRAVVGLLPGVFERAADVGLLRRQGPVSAAAAGGGFFWNPGNAQSQQQENTQPRNCLRHAFIQGGSGKLPDNRTHRMKGLYSLAVRE